MKKVINAPMISTSNELINKILLTNPQFDTQCEVGNNASSCTFLVLLYNEYTKCKISNKECRQICNDIIKRGFDLKRLSIFDLMKLEVFGCSEAR